MQPVCTASELEEDQARGVEIDGKSVVLVKKDGQVHAYLNWCPHLGIELNFMPDQFLDSDNAFLMCANHGALFEIDSGHCLSGPCSGGALMKIDVAVEGDQILLGNIPTP
ncbi:MAG: Rieske (2Fe-2S) protein [Alcanivoracaceae bacterium]|nr:Rieske (2Fe-2S) protein [Alcanivoracaceae bacterium]